MRRIGDCKLLRVVWMATKTVQTTEDISSLIGQVVVAIVVVVVDEYGNELVVVVMDGGKVTRGRFHF